MLLKCVYFCVHENLFIIVTYIYLVAMLLPCLVFLYLQLKLSSIWLFIQSHLPKIFALHIIVLGNSIRVFLVLCFVDSFSFSLSLHTSLDAGDEYYHLLFTNRAVNLLKMAYGSVYSHYSHTGIHTCHIKFLGLSCVLPAK